VTNISSFTSSPDALRGNVLVSNTEYYVLALLRPPVRFLSRDAMHKRGLCRHAVSVRPSVRLFVTFVDSVETNKHIFNFFTVGILIFLHETSWQYSDAPPQTPPPPMVASNAEGVGKNRDFRRISGYRIDDWWSANNCDCPSRSLHYTPSRISESLFITTSMDDHDEEKRRGQNNYCTQR